MSQRPRRQESTTSKQEKIPPLKADSEYPDWLWTIPEPPPSLFTLERKYSDDDVLTDENYEDVSCLRPSPFRAHQQTPVVSH